jgi:uncharacterized protein YjaG (DUF416 family)
MKKINLNKVEDLKPFINYESENLEVEITSVTEIKNDGVRFTVENLEDGHIQFIKIYLTKQGLPFYKKFVEDAGFEIKKAENPLYLMGEKLTIKTIFVNEDAKITKIVEVSPHLPI